MKKDQRQQRELDFLKKQFPKIKRQAAETKNSKLWHLEAIIRAKIKKIKALRPNLSGFKEVFSDYTALLRELSLRLLLYYNEKNKTDYQYEEIIKGNFEAYLNSGLISVLITNHIPKIITKEFQRLLPENPKDEYTYARQIKRKFILHLGETNTGKTYDALMRLKESRSGVYLAPLRILALENFERLNKEGLPCNLLTGEEEINIEGAVHSSCTVEKLDLRKTYEVAVVDEVQLLSDAQRGDAWTRAILGLRCPEIHLCGAINAKNLLIRIIGDCGDDFEIKEYKRLVPLKTQRAQVKYSDVKPGDALIAFSKRRVLALSRYFSERGVKNSVIYGDLPPEVRRIQYNLFIEGESKILISTDAVGMGVNLPIRRIVFTETVKFDGDEYRQISTQETKQIAGRAGRKGIYDIGYVASADYGIDFIENQLYSPDEELSQAVVGPSEAILNIGGLPLQDRLALWSTREESLNYYRKKDIRDYLLILDRLKPYKLPEATQWRLMMLPFDVNSEELLSQFLQYTDEVFTLKMKVVSRPQLLSAALSDLEIYYQKINLYYSYSKSLKLDFDEEWVYESRKTVSGEINKLL